MIRWQVPFLLIVALLNISAFVVAEEGSTINSHTEWFMITDSVAGYSIEYPEGTDVWLSEEKGVYRDLMITSPSNITMLKVTYLPGNQTLDELQSRQESALKKLSDYNLMTMKDLSLSGMPAVRYDYTWTSVTGEASRSFVIFGIDKSGSFIIRHDNSMDHFESDTVLIENIIGSLKIIPSTSDDSPSRAAGNPGMTSGWGSPPSISNSWNEQMGTSGQGQNGYSNFQYYQDPYSGLIYVINPLNGEYLLINSQTGLIFQPSTGSYYYYDGGSDQLIPYGGPQVQGQYNYPVDVGHQADIYPQKPPSSIPGYQKPVEKPSPLQGAVVLPNETLRSDTQSSDDETGNIEEPTEESELTEQETDENIQPKYSSDSNKTQTPSPDILTEQKTPEPDTMQSDQEELKNTKIPDGWRTFPGNEYEFKYPDTWSFKHPDIPEGLTLQAHENLQEMNKNKYDIIEDSISIGTVETSVNFADELTFGLMQEVFKPESDLNLYSKPAKYHEKVFKSGSKIIKYMEYEYERPWEPGQKYWGLVYYMDLPKSYSSYYNEPSVIDPWGSQTTSEVTPNSIIFKYEIKPDDIETYKPIFEIVASSITSKSVTPIPTIDQWVSINNQKQNSDLEDVDQLMKKGVDLSINYGKYEEALNTFDQAIKINPTNATAWYFKGAMLQELEKDEEAIKAYDQALQIDPEDTDAWSDKGISLDNLGKYEEAVEAYDQAIKNNPANVGAWYNKGISLDNLGRYEEAIEAYDQTIELDSEYVTAWYNKGISLDNLGRYEEAIKAYDQALQIDPEYVSPWNNKGIAFDNLGRYEEAVEAFDQALKIDPNNSKALANRKISLMKSEEDSIPFIQPKDSRDSDEIQGPSRDTLTEQGIFWPESSENKNETDMFLRNPAHKGEYLGLAAKKGEVKWKFETEGSVRSSPAVDNGVLYFGSNDGNVFALDMDSGSTKWKFKTGGYIDSSPAVVDGIVYVGSVDNNLYALDAESGLQKWKVETGNSVHSSPAVVDNVVYVGSLDDNVYAFDAKSGSLEWKFETGGGVDSSPAVVDNVVYVGSWDNNIYAIDSKSGSQKWKFETGDSVSSSPAVVDNVVYVGSWDRNIYAIDSKSGSQKWKFETGDSVFSSPIVANGLVYVGSDDKNIYAFDTEFGSLKWKFETGGAVYSSPAVVDNMVYGGSNDYNFYALDAMSGTLKWKIQTGDSIASSPTIFNGVVYIGSDDNNVYAIE